MTENQTVDPPTLTEVRIAALQFSDTAPQKARRKRFDKGELDELAKSIAAHGVLQPIIVRHFNTGKKKFEIVAGERRVIAAGKAKLDLIPAVVRNLSDEQVIEVQLIENLQRADVHPMEEAEGYHQLMKQHGHDVDELAARVGKSRSYIYGRLKLLALCSYARERFYDGAISASAALLIARIPNEEMQCEALTMIDDELPEMSFREFREYLQREFMLKLKDAPFPIDDADLVPDAGTCGACPKRTGNEPELFDDVKGADVCTDPTCYKAKLKAHGDRLIAEAQAAGREVILGSEAEKIAPHGVRYIHGGGFVSVNANDHRDPKNRKVKSIIGRGAETALLQDPKSGEVAEVVRQSVVNEALGVKGGSSKAPDPGRAALQKAKREKAFRRELYSQVRTKLQRPPMKLIAAAMFDRLHHETIVELCAVREFEPPVVPQYQGGPKVKDWRAIGKTIEKMSPNEAARFVTDMIYVGELSVSAYDSSSPKLLLEAAKKAKVDPVKLRRSMSPKKKTGRRKAKKKTVTRSRSAGAKRKTTKRKKA